MDPFLIIELNSGDDDCLPMTSCWPVVATLSLQLGVSLGACGAKARQLEARKNAKNPFIVQEVWIVVRILSRDCAVGKQVRFGMMCAIRRGDEVIDW